MLHFRYLRFVVITITLKCGTRKKPSKNNRSGSEALPGQQKTKTHAYYANFAKILFENLVFFVENAIVSSQKLIHSHAEFKFYLILLISRCVFEGQLRVTRYLQQLTSVPGSSRKVILPKMRIGKCKHIKTIKLCSVSRK